MTPVESEEIVRRAEAIYADRLKVLLEPTHAGEFVAIEPTSGEYFLGPTLTAAVTAARSAYPERVTYVMRVGEAAAIRIGAT